MEKIKILFLGNSPISLAVLKPIFLSDKFEIVGVVTNVDKKSGRNHSKPTPSPVADFAKLHKIHLIKTENINKNVKKLSELSFDILLTCSFGQILSNQILKLPKKIALNIHTSLLPKGRGGAPIHRAIINGEIETGFTLMEMVSKMDAGDYFYQSKLPITVADTYDTLETKLNMLIASRIVTILLDFYNKNLLRFKQNEKLATYWLNIRPEDEIIDFNKNSIEIYNLIRGLNSKPKAKFIYKDQKISVLEANYELKQSLTSAPGALLRFNKNGLVFQTKDGEISFTKIIIPGKNPTFVKDIVNGNSIFKDN